MAVKFKTGTPVRQVLPEPIEGFVTKFVFDETTGEIGYTITDINGQEWNFKEANLEEIY